MIDPWNRVLTNVTKALEGKCSNIVSSESDTPSAFPAAMITVIDNRDQVSDLENTETGVASSMRINTFSNKSLTEARAIMAVACDAMRDMGYRRTFGPREIENVRDRNVKRVEARFRRFVGSLDDIPKF